MFFQRWKIIICVCCQRQIDPQPYVSLGRATFGEIGQQIGWTSANRVIKVWKFKINWSNYSKEITSSNASGIVVDNRINCHMAQEVDTAGILRIISSDFHSIKFRCSKKVQLLSVISSAVIKVREGNIPINPTTFCQRISIKNQSCLDP